MFQRKLSRRYVCAVAFGLSLMLCVGLYWLGLRGGFFFDDGPSILYAPNVKIESISWDSIVRAWNSGTAGPSGRPIAQLSFALNYYISGFSPFSFKATNLLIHLINGLVLFGLLHHLISTSGSPRNYYKNTFPAIIALIWMLHPIQLLPVLHVVQRMTSLSALFLFAALYMHIAGRERSGRSGFIIAAFAWTFLWPLSLLSKETGLLFPVFVMAWEVIIRRHEVGRMDSFARVFLACIGLASLGLLIYMLSGRASWLWAGYDMRPFSMWQRLMTESRVLWMYLGLIFVPRRAAFALYHDDIPISLNLLTPVTTLPSTIGLMVLLGLAWRVRNRLPLVSFGIVWFFIGHLLESTVLPLEIAHEHRNYIPLLGALIAVYAALHAAIEKYPRFARPVSIIIFIYISASVLITGLLSHQFGDEVRRTLVAVQDHPESARAHYEAGSLLADFPTTITAQSPYYAAAQDHFQRSMVLNPDLKAGSLGLLYLQCKTGQQPDIQDVKELSRRLQYTPFAPGDQSVLYNIKEMSIGGTLCLDRSEVDNIFASSLANVTVKPYVKAILLSWYADYLWLHVRDLNLARKAAEQSLALNPSNASTQLKYAQLLFISGDHESVQKVLFKLDTKTLSTEEIQTVKQLTQSVGTYKQ